MRDEQDFVRQNGVLQITTISYFANICKFYVRMRSCSKQASRLATKLPVCVQYNVVKQNK